MSLYELHSRENSGVEAKDLNRRRRGPGGRGPGGDSQPVGGLLTAPRGGGEDGARRNPGEGHRKCPEGHSSSVRVLSSPGVLCPNGILRPALPSPRINKGGHEHRRRGSRSPPSRERRVMKFVGIDIASETHAVAVVDEKSDVLVKAKPFSEDADGYGKLLGLIGPAADTLVAMEATGHYWKNLFVYLAVNGFAVALVNPLRTHRFAGEDLQRTKTDAIDALGIARFAPQKRPPPTRLPA